MATYGLSWPTQGIDQNQVQDLIINPFEPTVIFSQVNMCVLMVRD
jgi:hypothetical protein